MRSEESTVTWAAHSAADLRRPSCSQNAISRASPPRPLRSSQARETAAKNTHAGRTLAEDAAYVTARRSVGQRPGESQAQRSPRCIARCSPGKLLCYWNERGPSSIICRKVHFGNRI